MRSILTGPNFIVCEGQGQLAVLRRIKSAAAPNSGGTAANSLTASPPNMTEAVVHV